MLQSVLGRCAKSFGMAAVVLRGNSIVAQGVAGVLKKEAADRITLDDRFHLGSCGKAMTAMLAAVLVEEGRLSWTDTLGRTFAGAFKEIHPAWEKITMPQLLAHCAGVRFEADRALQSRVVSSWENLRQQRLEIARHILARPPDKPPRTKFSLLAYSNLGYVLAAAALEHLTGRAWEDLMRERLFLPLGITTGGFGQPDTLGETDQPRFYGPAGQIHMTMGDWAKFVAIHLRGDPANPNRKPETFAELHSSATAGTYSAGWFTTVGGWLMAARVSDIGRYLWHGGRYAKSIAEVLIAPEMDFAVLIACNRDAIMAVWKARQAAKVLCRFKV